MISICMSTYNNCERLRITLNAFANLRCPEGCRWEVVVVNNACTDLTGEIVREFVGILPIVYVEEPHSGVSRGRNAGLKAASGEFIVFTDDDIKPEP